MRTLSVTGLVLGALLMSSATPASAKGFQPGDLLICDAQSCVPIMDRTLVQALGRFFYSGPAPAEIRAPRRGAPYFQLEFGDGDVTGIAATARLDRFRSRGVNMGQFGEDTW